MSKQRNIGLVLVAVWLLCGYLLFAATIRIPPSRPGAITVRSAGVAAASTGTGTYTGLPDAHFLSTAVDSAQWTGVNTGNGTMGFEEASPGYMCATTTAASNVWDSNVGYQTASFTGDFDVTLDWMSVTRGLYLGPQIGVIADASNWVFYGNMITPGNTQQYPTVRSKVGGSAAALQKNDAPAPAANFKGQMRLVRVGNVFDAYFRDAATSSWSVGHASFTRAISTTVSLRVGVSADSAGAANTAWKFDRVQFTSGGPTY